MVSGKTILVVEDDRETARLLRGYLEDAGYKVYNAYRGEDGLHMLRRERPHLVLLDLMLPDRDGWELTKVIRRTESLRQTPIIIITARAEDSDRVLGLELGADDYITKPFNPRVVLAHIRALLRRVDDQLLSDDTFALEYQAVRLDPYTHEVKVNDTEIALTPTEFDLLKTLMSSIGHVFTRSELVEQIFHHAYEGQDRSLNTHVMNLRRKIKSVIPMDDEEYIETIYGVGYRFGRRS